VINVSNTEKTGAHYHCEIMLKDHEGRLRTLEEDGRVMKQEIEDTNVRVDKTNERFDEMSQRFMRLENTIMSENRDTRTTINNVLDKQWEIINQREVEKTKQRERDNTARDETRHYWFDTLTQVFSKGGIAFIVIIVLLKVLFNVDLTSLLGM